MNQQEIAAGTRARVKNYAVCMMSEDRLLGSGTLVSRGGRFGILTAWHVFDACDVKKNPELREPFRSAPGAPMTIGYATDIPHNTIVPFQHLSLTGADNWQSEEWGPDVLFVALPESSELHSMRARKSFFPLDGDPPAQIATALKSDPSAWCLVGHPDTEKHDVPKSHGFDRVIALPAKVCFGCPQTSHDRDGWDYLDVPITRDSPDIPVSFGGVSGGGLWRTPLALDGEEVVGVRDPVLCGVAFYEQGRGGPSRFIRCHGPKSVYEKLCSRL